MSPEVQVALIGLVSTFLGGSITWVVMRKKTNADITGVITDSAMKLIQPLSIRIDELEEKVRKLTASNSKLREWAERLCCQIRELGGQPEDYAGPEGEEEII